jgi:protein-tyrosine-phosphatase/DNA-binding transcriptional ArsR family regulator
LYLGPVDTPADFMELLGHPLRWRLLTELARSDRKVRELADLLRRRQGLVSYHLGCLRAARLVSMRRSAADGRDAYYTIDLTRCGELIAATAEALHPALKLQPVANQSLRSVSDGVPVRVLFLCTGNSARSQMAEALLDHLSCGAAVAVSAGSHPKSLHPNAVRAMKEWGIDISGRRTKRLDEFSDQHFDIVVTLCDRLREICPEFPGTPQVVHWSIADPSNPAASDDESYPAFQEVAIELATRIRFLLFTIRTKAHQQEVHSNA